MIRVAYLGVSHWHLKFYLEPVLRMDDVQVVGVADPDQSAVARVASRIGCDSFADYRQMCEKSRPDFVFVLGRHVDMAEAVRYLLDTAIPFAAEKPVATSAREIAELAQLAAGAGCFAAVSFPWRQTPLAQLLVERAEKDILRYVMFRRLLGPPTRYLDWGSDWMLDRRQAAGGCTLNLSVHWIDLFAYVMHGRDIEVASAFLSSDAYGLSVEDYSLAALQTNRSACVVETGYLFPGGKLDMHFSVKSDDDYVTLDAGGQATIWHNDGSRRTAPIQVNPDYDSYVADMLFRWRADQRPDADLDDMRRVMEVVDAVYQSARWAPGTGTAGDLLASHVR